MRSIRYATFVKQSTLIQIRLTALDTQVNAISPEDLTDALISKVKVIDETATKKNAEFESLVGKLFSSELPADENIKDSEVIAFQEAISDLYIKIHSACTSLVPAADSRLEQSTASNANTSLVENVSVRLPTLHLGSFNGQIDKWVSFHSLFESTVHKSPNVSDVEKFTYLISCLHGEPLNLVKSLPLTSANYQIAWQQLIKRYNNSRLLITIHVNNILDLPAMHNSTVRQLRSFISTYQENASALKALRHDVASESLILTAHLLRKFDVDFRTRFEHSRSDSQIVPSIIELLEFLEKECTQLEAANLTQATLKYVSTSHKTNLRQRQLPISASLSNVRTALFSASYNSTCVYCSSSDHNVYKCNTFLALPPDKRFKHVQEHSLCNNCLSRHNVRNCNSQRTCNVCKRRHHTLLHFNGQTVQPFTNKSNTPVVQKHFSSFPKKSATSHNHSHSEHQQSSTSTENATAMVGLSRNTDNVVLLGTALVHLSTPNGTSTVARAVLDSAAQQTFITETCAHKLGISHSRTSGQKILGISSAVVTTKGLCNLNISSLSGQVLAKAHSVVILDNITSNLPRCYMPSIKEHMNGLTLADPTFDTPSPIDLLIGADLFAYALTGQTVSLGNNMPTALNTIFGYVLLGSTPVCLKPTDCSINLLTITNFDLHNAIQKFWCTENVPTASMLSPDEQQCEKHFVENYCRLPDGTYQVRLPLKQGHTILGDSSKTALGIFKSLEFRLARNPQIKEKYKEFMQDYENAGHMVVCKSPPVGKPHFFLPHHEVMRDSKIRVVFNASSVTSSGVSLNNILYSGPKLHNDIPDIIMGFRRHRIVFTCDIRQMFRNIWVHPDDRDLQLIYWRPDASQPLQVFQLTTVTYGMGSSPYLANRVIQQLIEDEACNHPIAAAALRGQIYVDDALLGANSLEEALQLQRDVSLLMGKGGFELRKWSSNSRIILEAVPAEHRGSHLQFSSLDQPICKVLGLQWSPDSDSFSYTVTTSQIPATKRSVLSAIAHLYDPMGWISPVVFWAKALMQILWTRGLQWDDPLPSDLYPQWTKFLQDLPLLEQVSVSRHVNTYAAKNIQLHGFCDASEAGYCASVILRVHHYDNTIITYLLLAKSRVSPLKRVSLPRLELCGAHMLSKLLQYCVMQLLSYLSIDEVFAWCDSTIALSWIQTPAYRLKTYVANRVAEIQDITTPVIWSHIASEQNPADCGSRGLLPSLLTNHPLWWNGPSWLTLPKANWPPSSFAVTPTDSLPELKPMLLATLHATLPTHSEILTRFSSWTKLIHITAYILRFVHYCRNKISAKKINPETTNSMPNTFQTQLSLQEIESATILVLKLTQTESFLSEITALRKNQTPSTDLQRLSPFLDSNGLIRVGGRLMNAAIDYNAKHPILLPKHHFVTDLLIDYHHIHNLHCGPQQLQSLLRQKYWILSARSAIRTRIFRCLRCYKCKPKFNPPPMADLPKSRVSPTRPFSTSAVDFAGPFNVKLYNLRRLHHVKIYLCLFICLSTKAVHLESVMDLTSEAFIASLTRFISRRGLVSHIYSDNATNFTGAARQLQSTFLQLVQKYPTQQFLTENCITFHFIPPRAPHFGGLWERAIQSAKRHMRRVIGEQILNIEEFSTLICRIEAMLNSRPIIPLSAEPSDFEALTPGHFLVGGPLVTLPEINLTETPLNHLRRWQLVQHFSQNIWKRWQRDYLHTLQYRPKWTKSQKSLEMGDLVLIHEDNSPPLQWRMGRVVNVFPGKDNIIRVAEVKTSTGLITRPVVKLSPLPMG